MQPPRSSSWRALSTLGAWLVALVIVFEEWGWAPLARRMSALARLPAVAWVERRIAALPPHAALVVFCVPMLLLLPVKVGALWLIAQGRASLGLLLFFGAKLLSTGVVARVFILTQPRLMALAWFARGYARWLAWKARVLARVRATAPWRAMRRMARRVRAMQLRVKRRGR
ncbi:MAG TPA: hypothetical protein VF453_05970 [Burkholderiaceae bacterium]